MRWAKTHFTHATLIFNNNTKLQPKQQPVLANSSNVTPPAIRALHHLRRSCSSRPLDGSSRKSNSSFNWTSPPGRQHSFFMKLATSLSPFFINCLGSMVGYIYKCLHLHPIHVHQLGKQTTWTNTAEVGWGGVNKQFEDFTCLFYAIKYQVI